MNVRTLSVFALMTMSVVATPFLDARAADEPVDAAVNAKIRDEGLHRSQVGPLFDTFVNVIGPRLTGSPAHKRAADVARERLASWGLANPRLESWNFGRGWELDKFTIEMIEPRYFPLVGHAEAWTPSTKGELVLDALAVAGKPVEEVEAMPLDRAAVLTQAALTTFISTDRVQPATQPDDATYQTGAPSNAARAGGAGRQTTAGAAAATAPAGRAGAGAGNTQAGAGARGAGGGGQARLTAALARAAVLLKPSRGSFGTVFVQAGRNSPAATTPAIVLMGEHYDMIARLVEHQIPVKLRVNVQARFLEADPNSYNVLADIPGTDPALKDQVVLLGAHLDSWHTATGATDNADGAAAVMEAFRILKAIGVQPRRTIRVALWSGEEQGLYGSKAYVDQHLAGDAHKAEREAFNVYFNVDPGYGPIYGWYLENNDAAKPIFDAWLAPFKDLGAVKNVRPGIPSTDHLSFTTLGLPGFTVIQDYTNYDTRLHHTNVDTAERIKIEDLQQNAIVLASFVYHAAMRAERIPRAGR